MKEILINYPIKFLQQELINIRTNYRLEKNKIIEILKTMKSIKKLSKEQLIEFLITYKYDISKIPKLEDLIKPKKERKPPKTKETKISTGESQILTRDELQKRRFYKIPADVDKMIKKIELDDLNHPTKEDKKLAIEIFKYLYKIFDNYENIKKELMANYDKLDKKITLEEYEKYIEDIFYTYIKNEIKEYGALFRDIKELYMVKYDLETSVKKGIYGNIKFYLNHKKILPNTYIKEFLTILNKYLELPAEKSKATERLAKQELIISTGRSQIKTREELERRREYLLQNKREIENKQFENLNKYEIVEKRPSGDKLIKMRDDYKKDKIMWSLEAIQKGVSLERILEIIFGGGYKQLNAFFTPDSVIDTMLDFSFFYQLLNSYRIERKTFHILETSGGIGNIIYYILENTENISNIKIDFVEVDEDFISIAQARLFKYRDIITYHHKSFFDFETDIKYDYIIGNPPFKISLGKNNNIYDVDFFNKCYKDFLKEGSKIVFVMSISAFTLKTESHKEFKKIINDVFDTIDKDELIRRQSIIELKNKFSKNEKGQKPVSTNVNTEIYIVEKPYED